jgi:small GTP-binding protein
VGVCPHYLEAIVMPEVKHIIKKMCMMGEAAVGKTSLIRRFVLDKFDDRYISTLGTKTTAKELHLTIGEGVIILKLQIWDILGLRCFGKLQRNAFRGANGAFFVLDTTRPGTLYSFENWLSSLYKVTGEIPIIVLANKNDLKAKVRNNEIEKIAMDYGFLHYFTSAKTGKNVIEAFETLGKLMIKPWKGLRTMALPEMPDTLEIEPEMNSDRKLSIFEVEDIIMARYCELLEDPDFAMAIMREQFKRAGLNYMCPTVQELRKAVEYLLDAASNRIEAPRLAKERKAYTNLIKMTDT